MGRDTIQLEDDVSTISQEYLLEFSSEYFIPENLHPELPGPGDHIVDFPEGKIGVYIKKIEFANFRIPISQFLFDILGYYQIHLSQLSVIVFPTIVAWRTAATKDDKPKANTYSVVDVATLDTHQMDLFNLIKAPNPTKVKTGTRQRTAHEVPLLTAIASCVIQMVDATELSTSSWTPSTVERSPLNFSNEDAPPPLTQGAKAVVHGLAVAKQEIPVTDDAGATEAVVEPNLKKEVIYMGPTIKKRRRQRDAGEGGSNAPAKEPPVVTQSVSDLDPLSYAKPQSKQDVAQSSKEKEVVGNQDSEKSTPSPPITGEKHIKDLEAQLEAEINMKKAAEAKNSKVTKELEDRRMRFSGLEVGNAQLSQQHEDERVNARCAEMDARLDALSVDFDEELLRKYGMGHGKAGLELTVVEAYDLEADNKYVAALHDLKDLNYPLIDELEQLKDAPLDVIMASLYLDSDAGEDAPQFIRDLRPSSSQLKIPVYPEVRNPRNPWACKDEILLEDAIAANISRVEKKKSRVICRTHRVGSAHHARSDGIPVSVPTIAPQGLQILLADAATQTEDEESPWLLRSKSLPVMFNLDWP
ncbi:hypothetical protein Tco_1226132 [Tanacetum coccineum]